MRWAAGSADAGVNDQCVNCPEFSTQDSGRQTSSRHPGVYSPLKSRVEVIRGFVKFISFAYPLKLGIIQSHFC